MLISMATPGVVPSPLAHPRLDGNRTLQRPILLSPGSRYYALLNQREKLSLLLLASRRLPFCSSSSYRPIPPSSLSFLRLTVANTAGRREWNQLLRPFKVPMNFINKTTLARCVARSYKAQNWQAGTLTRISARRTSVENLYVPGFPFLSTCRR